MERTFFAIGSLFAMLGVVAGAFGAHALRGSLSPDFAAIFETAVRYQLVHALGLLATAWACVRWPGAAASTSGVLFAVGIVLFSGSLYLLVLTGVRGLGAITPLGGLAFIAGWGCLACAAWRNTRDDR